MKTGDRGSTLFTDPAREDYVYGGWSPVLTQRIERGVGLSQALWKRGVGGSGEPRKSSLESALAKMLASYAKIVPNLLILVRFLCAGDTVGLLRKNCAKSIDFGVVSLHR